MVCIEDIDRPTMLYTLYGAVSSQQMNFLPENASQNDTIFPKSLYRVYQTTSQCLSSYGCAIIILNVIYSTVGRSIANIYDRSVIFTSALSTSVNISTEVVYRDYGPTYRTTYNILNGEYAKGEPFLVRRL